MGFFEALFGRDFPIRSGDSEHNDKDYYDRLSEYHFNRMNDEQKRKYLREKEEDRANNSSF